MTSAVAPSVRIGRYVLEERVGGGGSGEVFAARADGTGERVALKLLARAQSSAQARRMEREARALAATKHPHIVTVLESGRADDGRPYLVMPLLAGRSLRDEITARDTGFSPAETWSILRPIALALEAAHALGIVHRDVKPENVFLVDPGNPSERAQPRLLDFGLAKMEDSVTDGTSGAKLTDTGAPLGTPAYMPPEQWWNHGVGPASDQYALGVTAFEMLSRRAPFTADSFVALMQAHLNSPVPSLASVGVAVPSGVEAWIARALAKTADGRFASMRAAREAGDLAFGHTETDHQGISTRNRHHGALALGTALLAPIALVAAGYAGSRDVILWSLIAGYASLLAPPLFAFGLVAIYARRTRGIRWPALLPGLSGTIGTYTGWHQVLVSVARVVPTRRFMIFNEGMYEASVNRYVGFVLSAGLLLAADALEADGRAGDRRARVEALGTAAGFAILALVSALMGVASGALCAGAAAVAHAWALESPRARGEEIARAARRFLAVGMVFAAAITRVDGHAASLWSQGFSRARRAAEVTARANEHGATLALGLVALVGSIAFGFARARRAVPEATRRTPRRATLAFGAFVLAWGAFDAWMVSTVNTQRAALWATLAPQFALFARLDPPAATPAMPTPHAAPSLQIARTVVAVDGERVGLTDALAGPEGVAALGLDLSHRLAREGERDGTTQLSVVVDRHVRWESVARALGVAYGLGVRRAELLFTRGDAPVLSAAAPDEAAYVLPADFGALRLDLDDGSGWEFAASAAFEDVAHELAANAGRAPVRIRVAR